MLFGLSYSFVIQSEYEVPASEESSDWFVFDQVILNVDGTYKVVLSDGREIPLSSEDLEKMKELEQK